jgi:hypothetical protein
MNATPDWSQELLALDVVEAFHHEDFDRLEQLIPEHEEGPLTRGLISLSQWFAGRAAYELASRRPSFSTRFEPS